MTRKCKNCNGTGVVTGTRKRDRNKNHQTKRDSKCYYCRGRGER